MQWGAWVGEVASLSWFKRTFNCAVNVLVIFTPRISPSLLGPLLYHQMLSAVLWEPVHRVLSSRTAKPFVPIGGWYRRQEASMWSTVYSSAPKLQFAECTKHHLCIVELNSPTPVRRRFCLTQEGLGRVIPGGEGPAGAITVWMREVFNCHSVFHLYAQKTAVVLDLSRSYSSSSAAGTKGDLDLSSRCCVVGVNRSRSWRRCSKMKIKHHVKVRYDYKAKVKILKFRTTYLSSSLYLH